MKYKAAFNIYIDRESHPQIVDRRSAIAIAKSLTPNTVGSFDWDGECLGLLFKEYVFFETEASEGDQEFCDLLDQAHSQCKCPDPELSYVHKIK